MSNRSRLFLCLLVLASVTVLAGCQTMAPTSSSGSVERPRTICDAPSLRSQCTDIDAAVKVGLGPTVEIGTTADINPISEAMALLFVKSSPAVNVAVRVLESPTRESLAIVDPDEKWRVAVLRAALSRVKAPLMPRNVAIVVKDPSRYADLQTEAEALDLHLWLIPASQP